MNKALGGDGVLAELFKTLKDDTVKVLYSIWQQIWKSQQWPQDWKRLDFIPIPKKGNAQECSNYIQLCLFSHPGISSVQSFSCVWLFATPWTAACQASLSITNSQSLLKLMSIESVMPFNHLILCHPLLLLPSIFPSIRVFSNASVLPIRWSKYWSFSFSISHSNEYLGLISFRIDWLDLLAVQGTLRSLLQHHSSKASIFQYSAFFIVKLLHPYMTTGNSISLTRWAFV